MHTSDLRVKVDSYLKSQLPTVGMTMKTFFAIQTLVKQLKIQPEFSFLRRNRPSQLLRHIRSRLFLHLSNINHHLTLVFLISHIICSMFIRGN